MWVIEMYSSMGEACHYIASQRHDKRVCVNRQDQSPMADALVILTRGCPQMLRVSCGWVGVKWGRRVTTRNRREELELLYPCPCKSTLRIIPQTNRVAVIEMIFNFSSYFSYTKKLFSVLITDKCLLK